MGNRKIRAARRATREAVREAATTYYLDTSSIRSAGRNLGSAIHSKRARTSMLTIIELLAAIRTDEKNFFQRRAALRNLFATGIQIDWRTKETLIFESFDITVPIAKIYHEHRSSERSMKVIIQMALDSTDLCEFQRNIESAQLTYQMIQIERYDEYLATSYRQSCETGYRNSKQIFDDIQAGRIPHQPDTPSSFSLKQWSEWWLRNNSTMNRSMTISALAHQALNVIAEISQPMLPVARIHDTYNGKLDVFVDAYSIRHILTYGRMNFPERNDGIDIAHFYYLDRYTILLTEDETQKACAKSVNLRVRSIRDSLIPKESTA